MLGVVELPRSRHPLQERPLAELERPVEVSLGSAHAEPLALKGESRRQRRLVAELRRQRDRLCRDLDRLVVTLGPDRRAPPSKQSLEARFAVELRKQSTEL